MEEWRKIKDFPKYSVSDKGNVRNDKTNRILKPREHGDGYKCVVLYDKSKKNCRIHRLVATEFIDNPDGKREVNHINGDKSNNSIDNLEWSTPSENMKHSYDAGLNHSNKIPKNSMPIRIVETGKTFSTISKCAEALKCSVGNISECINKKRQITCHGYHFERITK